MDGPLVVAVVGVFTLLLLALVAVLHGNQNVVKDAGAGSQVLQQEHGSHALPLMLLFSKNLTSRRVTCGLIVDVLYIIKPYKATQHAFKS